MGHLDGKGYPGANFNDLLYLINVDKLAHTIALPEHASKAYALHPVQAASTGADARVRDGARFDPANGSFTVPARSTAVFVVR